jgi:uncharacterized membrane protein HdeD (DUF308 family)
MVTVVRLTRVVLLLLVAATVVSCIAGIGTAQTGPVEKLVLAAVIVALFFVAAGVTTVAERLTTLARSRTAQSA